MFRLTFLVLLSLIMYWKGTPSPVDGSLNTPETIDKGLEHVNMSGPLFKILQLLNDKNVVRSLENGTLNFSQPKNNGKNPSSSSDYSSRIIFGSIAALIGLGLVGLVRSCKRFKDEE